MPYKDRGESQSSGKELLEEFEATQKALDLVEYNQFLSLKFIGKSLGGIIFSNYLANSSIEIQTKSSLTILGYIFGDAVLPTHVSDIKIIQGENDKYGVPEQIINEIKSSDNKNIKFIVIKDADHSYRNASKEPEFQEEAIGLL